MTERLREGRGPSPRYCGICGGKIADMKPNTCVGDTAHVPETVMEVRQVRDPRPVSERFTFQTLDERLAEIPRLTARLTVLAGALRAIGEYKEHYYGENPIESIEAMKATARAALGAER